ncbi:tail fiber domain-containing protein [Streptomyces sp. SID10815]|uniref:tail fiber domain-containing protein n=1 Tax=Streptomyces sp. SID10815 TaxID=2706027 RepID=UPI0013C54515|nr:tail fiber domain-containing protein [Streptomyces sp. SID10815]NEA50461.1 tail fiber domain-containing protein [Streptomyces sp. SID10815]
MTITSYPFDSQTVTESQYGYLFREFQDSGVATGYDAPGFLIGPGTGMNVTVQPGLAILRGHMVQSTATETLAIPAAGTSPRIDRVVLKLDPAANSITLVVKQGAAGSSTPPATTQTDTGVYELALGQIAVGANVTSIGAADITATRPVVGHRIGIWATSTRPSAPRKGQLGFNNSLARWEWWDGAAWSDLAPTVSWSSLTGKPSSYTPSAHSHQWADISNPPASMPPTAHKHPWGDVTGTPSTYPPASHSHAWSSVTSKPSTFPPSSHSHSQYLESGDTISWANGTKRVHADSVSGSGTYYAVWVQGDGTFARNTSSRRFKQSIRDIDIAPEAVLALRPRVYDRRPKEDGGDYLRDEFGLIAEEVAETLPEIVTRDEEGQIDALRYDLLGVALLSVVQDQERRIAALEARVEELAR